MKYLLDAPDEEMIEWKAAAKEAGVKFAEWLRQIIREAVRVEVAQREPIEKRGGYQPKAAGPPPTVPPPKRSDSHMAAPTVRLDLARRDVTPHPRPSSKK